MISLQSLWLSSQRSCQFWFPNLPSMKLSNVYMKLLPKFLILAFVLVACDTQESPPAEAAPEKELPFYAQGTNAGSAELIKEVTGWTYHLMANQGRIAAYQFNEIGTVVATVGTKGKLDYPAMFWRIDEHDQIVVSNDRKFKQIAELWNILSIKESIVTIKNAANNREETYWRKRHWPPEDDNWRELLRPEKNKENSI